MVKSSSDGQEPAGAGPPMDENGQSKDCHNVVKSSGLGRRKRSKVCCSHKAGRRGGKVSVACQTEGGEASSSAVALPAEPSPESSRSEGLLRLMIQNFRNMTDTVRGPGKVVSGVPWKIMVMPRQHVVAKKGTQKCLGFFLQCCPDSYSDSWSCQASAELRLISQNAAVSNFVRKTTHLYTAKENDWGYSCFMTWADILEESQGYMKDEKVILEVFVKAESPKGILTHDAFCKKIEDYMRLADMQSSRGLIDKAIEVNQTAVKFCKDKDPEMKTELETQKARLIEQKLKQSIERIEKGATNGGPEGGEDSAANLNTLRNALKADWSGLKGAPPPPPPPAAGDKKASPPAKAKSSPGGEMDVVKLPGDVAAEEEKGTGTPVDADEASFSGDSDVSDSEDGEEEFCDSCLQEKLETISGEEVTTSEFSCQTELKTADTAAAVPRLLSAEAKKERLLSQLKLEGGGDSSGRWSAERESELLELITQESRASLDSIRDTLERLVSLAKDGEVPAGLELDLAALKEEQREREMLNADFVEIPSVEIPPPPGAGDAPPLPPPNPPPTGPIQAQPKLRPPAKGLSARKMEEVCGLGELSAEEQALVTKAKGLVQAKAEELMAKYSQLIQQSEATKLAETVKKVEKRMKDIEKQTMTCRKELSDECERHCREEAKLVKTNRGLKAQVDAATERAEKANAALKDRKTELKRLEKRLKTEGQLQEANADLETRIAALEKELAESKTRSHEASRRLSREGDKWAEAKKAMSADLAASSNEVDRLSQQLEERKAQIKKLESRLDSERRSHAGALREAVERAKKAEVNLLEFKLEMGLKLLERAQEDCQNNINHLDDIHRRSKNPAAEELKPVRAYMSEWERTRDRIGELMSKARSDFGAQVDAVKGGKALTQLPAIDVSKPPPPPQAPKMSPQQIRQATETTSAAQVPQKAPPAPIGRPTAVLNGNNNPGDHSSEPSPPTSQPPPPVMVAFPPPSLQAGMQTPPPSHTSNSGGADGAHNPITNGFSPWSDPLCSLTESLFSGGGRTMGGLGFGDSWNSSSMAGLGGPPPSVPTSHSQFRVPPPSGPPPATPSHQSPMGPPPSAFPPGPTNAVPPPFNLSQPPPSLGGMGSGGQWGVGWGYQSVTTAPPPPLQSPVPGLGLPSTSVPSVRPLSRLSGSPGLELGGGGGRGSPLGERRKRVETLMESLQATFPSFSPDALREYVNEYRGYTGAQSLKGLSVEAALNGVVAFIMSKNKSGSWKSDGKGGLSLLSSGGGALDSFGKYAPSPDEYPALT